MRYARKPYRRALQGMLVSLALATSLPLWADTTVSTIQVAPSTASVQMGGPATVDIDVKTQKPWEQPGTPHAPHWFTTALRVVQQALGGFFIF